MVEICCVQCKRMSAPRGHVWLLDASHMRGTKVVSGCPQQLRLGSKSTSRIKLRGLINTQSLDRAMMEDYTSEAK